MIEIALLKNEEKWAFWLVKYMKEIFNMDLYNDIKEAFEEFQSTHATVPTIFAPLCIYHDFLEDLGYYVVSE